MDNKHPWYSEFILDFFFNIFIYFIIIYINFKDIFFFTKLSIYLFYYTHECIHDRYILLIKVINTSFSIKLYWMNFFYIVNYKWLKIHNQYIILHQIFFIFFNDGNDWRKQFKYITLFVICLVHNFFSLFFASVMIFYLKKPGNLCWTVK